MKYNKFFFCLMAIFISSSSTFCGTIFWVSEGIRPNSMFSVYGDNLTGNIMLRFKETGDVLKPVQVDSLGRFATFIMPNGRNGVYTLQLSKNGGKTWQVANPLREISINKADLRWTSDTKVYPGLIAKVFGRNLNASEFNGVANTQLRFVQIQTQQIIAARVLNCTPFCIEYEAPAQLIPDKKYYIEVNTNAGGAGNKWVRMRNYPEFTPTGISVVPAPTHPLALALGVGWSVDFNWSKTINIRELGVMGDSSVDYTTPIKNAMQVLHDQGGGVLFFPEGTYCFTEILMPSGVIINGEGNDKTILKNIKVGCVDAIIGYDFLDEFKGMLGIANCKIIRSHQTKPLYTIRFGMADLHASPKGSHLFLYNNYIDMTEDRTNWFGGSSFHGIGLAAKEKVLFKNNTYIDQAPGFQKIQQDYQVVGNKIEYCDWAFEVIGSNRFIYCDNEITGKYFPPFTSSTDLCNPKTLDTLRGPKGLYYSIYSFSPIGNWGAYIANNHSCKMISNVNVGGDGALLTTDGFVTKLQGSCINASSLSVDVKKLFNILSSDTLPWNSDFQVKVIKGKGVGQLRKLTGHSSLGNGNYRLRVSPQWDVIPDNESEICVGQYHTNMVVENNIIDSSNLSIHLYKASFDNVIADNISRSGGGFSVLGQSKRKNDNQYDTYDQSAAFTVFKRCQAIGAGFDERHNKKNTGFVLAAWDQYNLNARPDGGTHAAWGPLLYGTEIRDCIVDRINSIDSLNANYWYFFDAGVSIGNGNFTLVENGESILATLIENIEIKNAPVGILAFGHGTNKESSIGCHTINYLTIRDFRTENVKKKYAEAGGCNTDNKVCIKGQPAHRQ